MGGIVVVVGTTTGTTMGGTIMGDMDSRLTMVARAGWLGCLALRRTTVVVVMAARLVGWVACWVVGSPRMGIMGITGIMDIMDTTVMGTDTDTVIGK